MADYLIAGTAPPEMKRDPVPNLYSQENEMKLHAIASAVVLFLVSTAAFAQDSKTTQGSSNSNLPTPSATAVTATPEPISSSPPFTGTPAK